ncbi:BMP family ABC transporter substrate-binding protein [uncultured Cellulomonas sp.]|uniref:BMP family lipoprotein n=1 Tax=uncultured Cellulomonas sp. TaxID=189682 RepID=UPI0028E4B965|nr:BMP family ABC transporter substrate-binding protein [uncultured Cellulomonas sp.]
MKKIIRVAVLGGAVALALAACGSAPEDTEETPGATASESVDFKACMVSDAGGFDDKSFNQSGFEGLTQAEEELGIEVASVESSADTDYTPNIDGLVAENCDLIIGVGFLLEDPIQAAAEANPDVNFALVDSSFSDADFAPVTLENGKPILFDTAQAAYLAGYVAAGTSTTGKVATFGGIQIPSVTIFMDGFADGIAKYNEDNGTTVALLGWDKAAQTGVFAGNFDSQDDGKNIGQSFIDQGADIIMPVAGPVGIGTASVAQAAGNVSVIGVDADWFETTEYGPIVLTSVMKEIGPAVFDTIKEAVDGSFSSDAYVGTLENEGLGLAPFHDLESKVATDVVTKIDELKAAIIAGDIVVESDASPK